MIAQEMRGAGGRLSQISAEEERVLAKGVIRAADKLGISQKQLAIILGVSGSTVSRIRRRSFVLERGSGKAFELALLFMRFYVSLDAIVGGDEGVARAWLRNRNDVLRERPIDLLKSVRGLVAVGQYLDHRKARL
jgi:transcriptional regulator with XRE-family HTH domain